MSNKTGPCKALIAYGMNGTAVVIATDNRWLAEEIDNIPSDGGEDLGLTADGNEKAGLWLFEGEGTWIVSHDQEGFKDVDLEWEGTEVQAKTEDLPALLSMKPNWEDEVSDAEDSEGRTESQAVAGSEPSPNPGG